MAMGGFVMKKQECKKCEALKDSAWSAPEVIRMKLRGLIHRCKPLGRLYPCRTCPAMIKATDDSGPVFSTCIKCWDEKLTKRNETTKGTE